MLCDAMFALYLLLLPLFSPVDPETNDAPVIDYVDDDTSSFLAGLPGKQTPIDHFDIAHSLLSYACIRTATTFCMILL